MTIYVDKVFFEEFGKRDDLENEVVEDFYKKFLRKVRGAEILINLSSIKELKDLSEKNRFYIDLLEINPGITIKSNWKDEVIEKNNIHVGNPIKVFLLSNTDNCEDLEKRYGYLFINNNNLIEKWSPVRWDREITTLAPGNNDVQFGFSSWSRLGKEKHPFTELLILDLYILGDKFNQRIEDNIIPLIKSLLPDQNLSARVLKVTIITNHKEIAMLGITLERINRLIPNIELCIIHYDYKFAPNNNFVGEHDREIYTNYLKFECGAGWNIFKTNGRVNHRTTITIQSMVRNDVRNASAEAWKNLNEYRNKIKDGDQRVIPGSHGEDGKLKTELVQLYVPNNFKSYFLNN